MPLVPQIISIPTSSGLDTRNNPVLVDKEKWTVIQNMKFTKGANGQLVPRNGYSALPTAKSSGGNLTACQALAICNGELDVLANYDFFAFSDSQQKWIFKGATFQSVPSRTPIVRNNYNQSAPDSATANDVTVYAWIDARGGVWYKVVDQDDGTVLISERQLDSAGSSARVIANSTTGITVMWATTAGTIKAATLLTASATTPLSGPTSILTSQLASTPFEVTAAGTDYAIANLDSSSYANLTLVSQAAFANVAGPTSYNSVAMATVSCCVQGNGNIAMAAQAAFNFSVPNQTMYVVMANPTTLVQVTSHSHSLPAGSVLTMWPGNAGVVVLGNVAASHGQPRPYIVQSSWGQVAGYGGDGDLIRGCGLVSAPFQVNAIGGAYCVLVSFLSSVQPTYFLLYMTGVMTDLGIVIGRFVSQNAGSPPTIQTLCHSTIAAGGFSFAVSVEAELLSSGGQPVIVTGIDNLIIDFSQTQTKTTQLGKDLSISGSLPQLYDSEVINENGFNTFPEAPTLTVITSMIGITAIIDGITHSGGGSSTTQSFLVTFPVNQASPGIDGTLLENPGYGTGEYITVGASNAFWFSVDYAQSAPTGLGGCTLTQIAISSQDSAATIAGLFAANVTAILGASWTAVANGTQVLVTAKSAGSQPRPQTYSQFNVGAYYVVGGVPAQCAVNCIPGSLVPPGSWFSTGMADTTDFLNSLSIYVWFKVGGVGTDPQPAGYQTIGIECDILTTDTESQVATKLAAAVVAYNPVGGGAIWTASRTNQVVVIGGAGSQVLTFAPNTGTVGQCLGTVGPGVAANQWDSYSYSAIFESQDSQGQLARSAPAVTSTVTFPAYGTGNFQVQVKVPPLYLTSRSSVDVAIYRTQTTQSLLYRATSETALLYNVASNSFMIFTDQVPDSTLQANELCYSQPLIPNSVIPNNCPPAYSQAATFQDQMWINCEDSQTLWFSKPFTTGVQVEYSNLQTLRFDPVAGPIVAMLPMDSNLIVFGTLGIWAVSGLGPNDTGGGTDFSVTLVSAAAGCRDAFSVVLTPTGIIFKSQKGFLLLDRSLQVHMDFGDPVVSFLADVVTSAQVVPNTNEVRFLSESGTTQLYDYEFNQWASHTNFGKDSIIYDGAYYYMLGTGYVLTETPGLFSDNGVNWAVQLATGWLKPGAIQGFGRIWRIYLEGSFPNGTTLQLQIAYDYDPTIVDTYQITLTSDEIQIPFFPSRQQCESIQLTIGDVGALSSSVKMALNSIDLEIGVQKGIFKGFGGAYQYPQSGD